MNSLPSLYRRKKRSVKKKLYRLLLRLSEQEFHISKGVLAILLFAALFGLSFFLPEKTTSETALPQAVLGSELSKAVQYTLEHDNAYTKAEVILLLLPIFDTPASSSEGTGAPVLFSAEESSPLSSPLYSIYLSGREIKWLTELYASLSDSFSQATPYIGGVQFTYNPYRLILNRVTDAVLLRPDGTVLALDSDSLYHVVGNEGMFSMFHYLRSRSEQLFQIQPKAADGTFLSDYSVLLNTADGSALTLLDTYKTYLQADASVRNDTAISNMTRVVSFHAVSLLKQPNRAGVFVFAASALFICLFAFLIPRVNRIYIWFRIYRIRRRKRSSKRLHVRLLR